MTSRCCSPGGGTRLPAVDERWQGPAGGIASRLRVGQWLGFTIGLLLALAVAGITLALVADGRLASRRDLLVDRIQPAQLAVADLANALINQETGLRGFLITRQPQFLQPYDTGMVAEQRDYDRLRSLLRGSAESNAADAELVRARADAWHRDYVTTVLPTGRSTSALDALGKARFDAIRSALARLDRVLTVRAAQVHGELDAAARTLTVTLAIAGVLIVVGLVGAAVLLRLIVTAPLARLGQAARRVTEGDLETPLAAGGGAREIADVREDVEAMRGLIVGELEAMTAAQRELREQAQKLERQSGELHEQALELERSNAELEQFAYVASHDLQEPLRKVASFCQALDRRYRGRLDDRADQYLEFAVDGAKRMQALINDLLAFSRVGRSGREHELLDVGELVEQARSGLSQALEEAGATVAVSTDLPTVRGDRALLASVFQNLITNAIKFRGPDPPMVRIDALARDGCWEFSATDNGIGIGAEYRERVFVIFQRLHPRDAYPGTGIGLAMCRKIVEYHGGRIWADAAHAGGTRIRFTLPMIEDSRQ